MVKEIFEKIEEKTTVLHSPLITRLFYLAWFIKNEQEIPASSVTKSNQLMY